MYKEKNIKIIIKFIMNITICYVISYGLAKPLISYILFLVSKVVQENVAMIVGMGLFVILNYPGQKFAVFK